MLDSYVNHFSYWLQSYEFSVFFRLVVAVLFGGYIGAERIRKRRPAGIKTHAIVSLGAALVVLTNEYMYLQMPHNVDVARMAGQVVSGVGFLGAGTIMINGRNQVTGLTTAAGIWLSACIGIAVGIGFEWAALVAMILLAFINGVMGKIDIMIQSRAKIMNVSIDLVNTQTINNINKCIIDSGCSIISSQAQRSETHVRIDGVTSIIMSIYMHRDVRHKTLTDKIALIEGVIAIEEI